MQRSCLPECQACGAARFCTPQLGLLPLPLPRRRLLPPATCAAAHCQLSPAACTLQAANISECRAICNIALGHNLPSQAASASSSCEAADCQQSPAACTQQAPSDQMKPMLQVCCSTLPLETVRSWLVVSCICCLHTQSSVSLAE